MKKSQVVKLKMEPAVMDELEGCTPLKAESAKGVVVDELRDARDSQDGEQGEDAGVSAKDGRVNDELMDQGATSSRDQNVLMDAGEDLSMIGKRPDDPNGNLGERPRDDPSQAYGEAPNDHVSSPTQENTAVHLQDDSPQHEEPPEDVVILYHTLVRDGALPEGCEREFATLAKVIAPAAAREQRRMASLGNVQAAVWLHDHEKRKREEEKVVQQTEAQFQWAASERPRKFSSRLEKSLYDGPTARRDAEEAERQRWLHVLADLVRHSPTPMGQLLAAQPGNVEVLGGGKRASTLGQESVPSGSS